MFETSIFVMQQIDNFLLQLINQLPHSPLLDVIALAVHYSTYTGGIVFFLCFYNLFRNDQNCKILGKIGLIGFVVTTVIVELVIKNIIGRGRPYTTPLELMVILPFPGGFSFPSTQTAIMFTLAGMYWTMFPKSKQSYAVLMFAFVTGFNRIYMAHHYPSDVLFGALIGLGIAGSMMVMLRKQKSFKYQK